MFSEPPPEGARRLTSDRWQDVLAVVDAALKLPADSRPTFLASQCVDDPALLAAAQRLLDTRERAEYDDAVLSEPDSAASVSFADENPVGSEGAEAGVVGILDSALAGHYSIERVLGRGGMATVYLARDVRHHRHVAIKVLRADLVRELGAARFLREIEIAAKLQHRNILPLFDSGEADRLLYYIMPFVAGESLRVRLDREHQLTISSALSIVRDVAQALDYAHSQGIVHRDIKPANILLEGSRSLIADFGVARAIAASGADRLTGSGLAIGTTRYMSPEQAAGQHDVDGRSDVYSLGCVVFEMFTGEPPFTAPTPQAVMAKHMHAPVPDARVVRPTIGAQTQQVLITALAKMPADRFATAGDFVRSLEASLSAAESRKRRRITLLSGSFLVLIPAVVLLLQAVGDSDVRDRRSEGLIETESPRVAVLYFDDLTSDSSLRHIADGLTEELIHELSGVNAFQVVPKSGVKQFRGVQVPFDSLVQVLGVNTIVDGSLQRAGDQIRVMVQLIDARTNSNIDIISLERHTSEFATLGRDVAQQLATALRRRMGRAVVSREEIAGASSPEAEELVLKAWRARDDAEELAKHPHPDERRAALENLTRADSLLSLARAADGRWLRPILDRGWVAHQRSRLLQDRERTEAAERGLAFAETALTTAPRSAEAHELRGTIRWAIAREMDTSAVHQPQRLREAESDLRTALDQDSSSATAWATLSELLLRKGNFVEADLAAERAVRQDAYLADARQIFERLFYSAVWNGDLPRAAEWCRRGQASFPGYWRFVECELTLLREDVRSKPDADRAWRIVADLERIYTSEQARVDGNKYSRIYWRVVAAAISARAGEHDLARTEMVRARRAATGDSIVSLDLAYDEAYLRLALGERARADSLLRELVRARPGTRALIARDPLFRELPLPWLRLVTAKDTF